MDNAYHPVTIGGKPDSRYTVSRKLCGHERSIETHTQRTKTMSKTRRNTYQQTMQRTQERIHVTRAKRSFILGM